MKISLMRNAFMLAIALVGFGTASFAQSHQDMFKSMINDAYTLYEELIIAGSKVTGFADASFHARFAEEKKEYFDRFTDVSSEWKEEIAQLNNQIQEVLHEEDKQALRLPVYCLLLFAAPYGPDGDLLLIGLSEAQQTVLKGFVIFWAFNFFVLLNEKDSSLAQNAFALLAADPRSPLYPVVHSFEQPLSLSVMHSVVDTLEQGLNVVASNSDHKGTTLEYAAHLVQTECARIMLVFSLI